MTVDLPVRNLDISFSELSSWRRCQFQHWLAYRRRMTSTVARPPLVRGIAWDGIMNEHYAGIMEATAAGCKPADRLEHPAFVKHRNRIVGLLERIDNEDLRDLLGWMYMGYLEQYGADRNWDVLSIQHKGLANLWPIRMEDHLLQIRLKVVLDLIVRVRARWPKVLIVDHKSTTTIGHNRDADMDDQQGLYEWFVSTQNLYELPVDGTLLSYALARRNKVKPQALDERFVRIPAMRTEVELSNIAADAIESAVQAYSQPLEWQPPRSPHPEWCRRECDYLDACLAGRKGFDVDKFLHRTGYEQPIWFDQMKGLGLDEFMDSLPLTPANVAQ